MKRLLLMGLSATWLLACTDSERSPVGPESLPVAATHVPGGSGAMSCMPSPADAPGLSSQESPCDAHAAARNANHHPGTAGFFFRAPTASTPPTGTFVPGFESSLTVVAYRFKIDPTTGDYIDDSAGNGTIDIGGKTPVTAVTGSYYKTQWKTPQLRGQTTQELWRVWISLEIGAGSGAVAVGLGFRDFGITDDPSQGQPLDNQILFVRSGSNQNIHFILDDSGGSCFGTAVGQDFVQCVADMNRGAELTLDETTLIVAPGSQGGVVTITGISDCEGVTAPDGRNLLPSELLDIPTWTCKNFSFSDAVTLANGSCILFDGTDNPFPPIDPALEDVATIHMVDDQGILSLPPVDAADCATIATEPTILKQVFDRLAGLLGVRELVATGAVGHGSAGGGLGGVSPGSDFLIARPSVMQNVTPLTPNVTAFGTTNVQLSVTDHQGDPVGPQGLADEGATVHLFAQPDADDPGAVSVACPVDLNPGNAASDAKYGPEATCLESQVHGTDSDPHVDFSTGATGLAEVAWTIGDDKTKLWALGCAIAVSGTIETTGSGFPGDAGPCDLDPGDTESQTPPGTVGPGPSGFPNGPVPGPDPFMPEFPGSPAVWANDLTIEFEAQVCATPDVTDGSRDGVWTDPNCVDSATIGPLNLSGGGPGTQPDGTLYWLHDGTDLYLGFKLPRPSSEDNTTIAYEFDLGVVSDGTADINDDLFEISQGKVKGRPTQAFIDRYLESTCLRASSICGTADASQDGAGSIGFDDFDPADEFIWYELKHPLGGPQGCPDSQDFCVNPGDTIGMFMRIAVGNAPTGGTAVPGVRQYMNLVLRP